MPFEQKEMSGSLFKNDRRTRDSEPNAKGTAKINGVEFWVSAWTNKDKNGNPWQALKFTPKEQKQEGAASADPEPAAAPAKATARSGSFSDMPDDIPFAPIARGISGHAE